MEQCRAACGATGQSDEVVPVAEHVGDAAVGVEVPHHESADGERKAEDPPVGLQDPVDRVSEDCRRVVEVHPDRGPDQVGGVADVRSSLARGAGPSFHPKAGPFASLRGSQRGTRPRTAGGEVTRPAQVRAVSSAGADENRGGLR